MKCIFCGSEMYLDDRDFRFKGCENRYYNCTKCSGSVVLEIRYGYHHKGHWHYEDDQGVINQEIRYSGKGVKG